MVCTVSELSRRKLFWATQPDACGSQTECGFECGEAGLSFANEATSEVSKSLETEDWVRGLVINMLLTDGRKPDTNCGYNPNGQGGHWSESYISSGPAEIGTLLRTLEADRSINESVALISAYAKSTLNRLVERGVALSVDVEAKYLGNYKISLAITINGTSGQTSRVGLSTARLQNGWIWQ